MKQPKVTLLMRAYNAEKYVAKAIESALDQTDGDFEFIIRNNGSTDGTGQIIQRYLYDKRIVYLENKVNWVLDEADGSWWPPMRGEYIAILDADDFLDRRFIEVMYPAAKRNQADLTVCGCVMFQENAPDKLSSRIPPDIETNNLADLKDIFVELYGTLRTVWGKLYQKDFYLEHYDFAFDCPILASSLDTYSVLGYLQKCRSFVSMGQSLYHYCIRDNSSSRLQAVPLTGIKEAEYLFLRGQECLKALGILTQRNSDSLYLIHQSHIHDLLKLVLSSQTMTPAEKAQYFQAVINDRLFALYSLNTLERKKTLDFFAVLLGQILQPEQAMYVVGRQAHLARYYLCDREIRTGQISILTLPRLLSVVCDNQNEQMIGDDCLALRWQVQTAAADRFLKLNEKERVEALKDKNRVREIFSKSDNPNLDEMKMQSIQDCIDDSRLEAALDELNRLSQGLPLSKECLFFRIYLSYLLGDLEYAMDALNIALFFWDDDEDIRLISKEFADQTAIREYAI